MFSHRPRVAQARPSLFLAILAAASVQGGSGDGDGGWLAGAKSHRAGDSRGSPEGRP
jgi:hypothetical protein